jgi:hypothetical protein
MSTFICDHCHDKFDQAEGDHEEAIAEAAILFPDIDPNDPKQAARLCDDCFEWFMGVIGDHRRVARN